MATKIELDLDDHGRILVPAETLDALGLSPGMTLVVEADENGGARLNIQRDEPMLVDKGGVLVIRAEAIGDIDDSIRRDREERIASFVQPTEPLLVDEDGVLVATHEVVGDMSDAVSLERERRIREVWERTGQ